MIKKNFALMSINILLLVSLIYGQKDKAQSAMPNNIRLTWSESPKTTRTIGWTTDSTVSVGKIKYKQEWKVYDEIKVSYPEILSTNAGKIGYTPKFEAAY